MLPLLKHKTFHQMREIFEMKAPKNQKLEKQHIKEINKFSYFFWVLTMNRNFWA